MADTEKEQSLTEIFQDVVDHTNTRTTVESFNVSIEMLRSNFLIAYKLAGNDEKTKRVLIEGLTNFTVEIAERKPKHYNAANTYANAVQVLCDTLTETIKENKSFIPPDFSKRLLEAALQLAHLSGSTEDMKACTEASKAISAIADQFPATPASSPAPRSRRTVPQAPKAEARRLMRR